MTVTAIVLAGGRSARFGADKLAADLDGTSILGSTIAAVATLADEIVVAGPGLPAGFEAGGVRIALVADIEPFGGPLAALANVISTAIPVRGDLAIVVGGDMPGLVPSVLASMLDVLDVDPTVDAVLLGRTPDRDGVTPKRAVLPLAVRLDVAAPVARAAIEAGDRSLQAYVDRLSHVELPAERWMAIDPEAQTLADVDTPADLERVRRRHGVR